MCKINNINIKEKFNGDVVSFSPSTMKIDNNIVQLENSYGLFSGIQQLNQQERTLIIDFWNEDDMSNFTAEVSSSFILDINDGYKYFCTTKSNPDIKEDGYMAYTYSLPVYCLKQKDMIIHKNVKGSIFVLGNVYAEAIVEIHSVKDIETLTINDITISNLKANDTLIIDGIDKMIFYESNPDYSVIESTDLTSFPVLNPGKEEIDVSDESVNITIKYYPTYM